MELTEPRFKRGDRVRRISVGHWGSIEQDQVYTVQSCKGLDLITQEFPREPAASARFFELVEPYDPGVAFRVTRVLEASADGGRTWVPVPSIESFNAPTRSVGAK